MERPPVKKDDPRVAKYLTYLQNADPNNDGLEAEKFDEDWDPVGHMVRAKLTKDGFFEQRDGKVFRR